MVPKIFQDGSDMVPQWADATKYNKNRCLQMFILGGTSLRTPLYSEVRNLRTSPFHTQKLGRTAHAALSKQIMKLTGQAFSLFTYNSWGDRSQLQGMCACARGLCANLERPLVNPGRPATPPPRGATFSLGNFRKNDFFEKKLSEKV